MSGPVKPDKGPWWVRYHWSECVLCGRENNYRERVYISETPKPTETDERHHFHQYLCSGHWI